MNTQSPTPAEQILLTWKAPVQPVFERTSRWYTIAGTIVVAITAYGIISGAWSVALVAVISAGTYFLVRNHRLPDSTISITEQGIHLEQKFLPWSVMKGYWINNTPEYVELHVVPQKARDHDIKIQTGSMDIFTIKQTLAPRIPELTNKRERLVDTLIRLCKL